MSGARRFGRWIGGACVLLLTGWLMAWPVPQGQPAQIIPISGNNQTGFPNVPLAERFGAKVLDAQGNPVAGVKVWFVAPAGSGFEVADVLAGTIDTWAGGGSGSLEGIPATESVLMDPVAAATDQIGNLFVADRADGRIRRIDAATGAITTIAGGGPQPFTFSGQSAAATGGIAPRSLEIGAFSGDLIFVDESSARVFRIDPTADQLWLVAGGGASTEEDVWADQALLPAPRDATEDYWGNVYVAVDASTIRRVDVATGEIHTVASTPTAILELGYHPDGRLIVGHEASAAQDPADGLMLLDPTTGAAQVYGIGSTAAATADAEGAFFLSLEGTNQIGHMPMELAGMTPVAGTGIAGFSGDGGSAPLSELQQPRGLAVDSEGDLFIVDEDNGRVRKVTFAKKIVQSVAAYTNGAGIAYSPFFVPSGGSGVVVAHTGAGGLQTQFAFTDPTAPGGPDAPPPPPIAIKRPEVTDDPELLYPRWTPPVEVTSAPPQDLGGGEPFPPFPPLPPLGGTHRKLAVDADGIVHVIQDINADSQSGQYFGIGYFNNRLETRYANGFSAGLPISTSPASIIRSHSAIDVDADGTVHFAWVEYEDTIDEFGRPYKVWYRKLTQDPPALEAPVLVFERTIGPNEVKNELSGMHMAVAADGTVHLAMMRRRTVEFVALQHAFVSVLSGFPNCEFELFLVDQIQTEQHWEVLRSVSLGAPTVLRSVTEKLVPQPQPPPTPGPAPCFFPVFTYPPPQPQVEANVGSIASLPGFGNEFPGSVDVRVDASGNPHYAWIEFDRPADVDGMPFVFTSTNCPGFLKRLLYSNAGAAPVVVSVPNTDPQDPTQNVRTFDFAVDSTGLPHFIYREGTLGRIQYRRGPTGTLELIAETVDAIGGHDLIAIDAEDIPHIVWPSGYARRERADAPFWNFQVAAHPSGDPAYPGESPHPAPGSMFVDAVGGVHVLLGGFPSNYSRSYDPNLGEQDSFLMFGLGPNTSANVGNGNLTHSLPLFSSRGVGFSTNFSLVYNSLEPEPTNASAGWSHNYDLRMTHPKGGARFKAKPQFGFILSQCAQEQLPLLPSGVAIENPMVRLGDGRRVVFGPQDPFAGGGGGGGGGIIIIGPPGGGPDSPTIGAQPEFGYFSGVEVLATAPSPTTGQGGTLLQDAPSGTLPEAYRMTTKFGVRYIFDRRGRLTGIFDTQPSPNAMTFAYADNALSTLGETFAGVGEEFVLTSIADSAGRQTGLSYDASNHITGVVDPAGTSYGLAYGADAQLQTVSFPLGISWKYGHYAETDPATLAQRGLLSTIQTPRLSASTSSDDRWDLQYWPDRRVAGSVDPKVAHVPELGTGTETIRAGRAIYYFEPITGSGTGSIPAGLTNEPHAFVFDRRKHDTTVRVERRRQLAEWVRDPDGHLLTRQFAGQPGDDDGYRNLVAFTDKNANTTTYTYHPLADIFGGEGIVADNLATISRPGTSLPISYTYTSTINRVAGVTDARGKTTTYEYDGLGPGVASAGNLTTIAYAGPGGNRHDFDATTATIATVAVPVAQEKFEYDSKGRVTFHTSPNQAQAGATAKKTKFEYTNLTTGLVTRITRPDHAKAEEFAYDGKGNTTTHKMPEGGTTAFTLDALSRVTHQIEPSGDVASPTTVFEYDADSNVKKVTDPRGAVTEHFYDSLGRLVQTKNAHGDSMFFAYDRSGNPRSTIDFRGATSTSIFDKLGRVTRTVRPGPPSMVSEVDYDASGNAIEMREIGATTRVTTHEYDVRHNPIQTTHAIPSIVDETQFDDNDNVVQSIRKEAGVFMFGTRSVLDDRNRVVKTTELLSEPAFDSGTGTLTVVGHSTIVRYDPDNSRIEVEDAEGKGTRMAYDAAGRQRATEDGDGDVVSAVDYNDNDLRVAAYVQPPDGIGGTGPGGMLLSRSMGYNARNELKTATDALGFVTQNFYDAAGNLVRTLDEDAGETEFVYDLLGRLTQQKQHVNAGGLSTLTTGFGYDPNGNRTSITDPRGKIYAFEFDAANRMTKMKTPLLFEENWTYDAFGQLATHTDANGKVATSNYDDLGRLKEETHTLGGIDTADIHRVYDGASNLTEILDEKTGILIRNVYTKKNELQESKWFLNSTWTGEATAAGPLYREISYTFLKNGLRSQLAGPDTEVTDYFYDDDNRLERVVRDGILRVRLAYDAQGRRVRLEYVNGPDAPTTAPVAVTRWTYTARGEIKTVITTQGETGPLLAGYSYAYDHRGNTAAMDLLHQGASVVYQNLPVVNWLAGEIWSGSVAHSLGLTYDPNGNRASHQKDSNGVIETAAYLVDDDNRLLAHERLVQVGFSPGGTQQVPGTPIVDSTKPGHNPAVIADSVTTDSPAPPDAWINKDTGAGATGKHFAGLEFAVLDLSDTIEWFTPSGGPTLPAQANPNAQPPGNNAAGAKRFKPQALVGGVWTDIAVASITGAQSNPSASGWFETTDPVSHEIVMTYAPIASSAIRILMDAGGGSPAHPNRLVVNEIQVFKTLPGAPIFETGLITYGYDAQGNMVSRSASVDAELLSVESFGVDYMNRISSYVRQDGSGNTQAFHTYLFTPTGNRICSSDLLAATSEWMMYDGADVVADYATTVGGTSFTRTAAYVQSLAIDSKHVKLDGAGANPTFYIPDALGSVGVRIDASGSVIDTRITNAWGENLAAPGSDRHGFTGREAMPEIVLPFAGATPAMHYRARTYFPEIGRFGQRDPAERTSRCYKYVENRPTGAIDPTGLQEKSVEKWMRWIERQYRKVSASPDLNTVWQRVWIKQLDMDRDDDTWYDCVDDFTNILEAFYELYVIGNKESDTSPHFADWPQLAVDASRDNSLATHFFLGASYGEFGRVISEAAELGDPKNHPDTRADMAAGYLGAYLGWYVTQIGDTNCRKIAKLFAAGTVKFEDLLGPPTDLVNIRAGNLDSDRWARKRAFEDLPDLFGTPKISGIGFGPGISDDAGFPNWQF